MPHRINGAPYHTSRLALETQMDTLIGEHGLASVIHAIVEVLYGQVRRCGTNTPLVAAFLAYKARQLTELECECETWRL